ncbi:MAG: FAD-binding protein [Gemmataceae bacterium]|nr:FAD-binding protein [Gemmataceae bacterium]
MVEATTVADDLRGVFRGALRFDVLSRGLYARDASFFHVEPWVVAIPQDVDDVAVLVRYCYEHNVPLVARGAGTGLAGESVGTGVVVDLSVHLRQIRTVEEDSVTVEAGVRWSTLAAVLAPHGRRFPPDPASGAVCTLGGMVATNASGANLYKYGYTRDYVLGLEVIWDNGETAWLTSPAATLHKSREPLPASTTEGPRTQEIRRHVTDLLTAHRHLIACRPTRTPYDRCGYRLDDVWTPAGADLARLLVGSEGTLGLITAARLRTLPLPAAVVMVLLGFRSLEAAVRAGQDSRRFGPTACDLLDQRLLSLRRRPSTEQTVCIPAAVAAVLLVSIEADTLAEALDRGWGLAEAARQVHQAMVLVEPTASPAEHQRLQDVRREAVRGWYALAPGPRPVPGIEDLGVPPDELVPFLTQVRELLQRREITASFLIHVLTGQVHLRPLLDLDQPSDRLRLWRLAEEVHELVLRMGGTVSTQHGVGWARTPWVERQTGPLFPLFREIKRIFDPKNLLNPGKIVGPDPSREAWPLYPLPDRAGHGTSSDTPEQGSVQEPRAAAPPTHRYALPVWTNGAPAAEAARCTRCGDCRDAPLPQRMCPLFHLTGLELAAPRAKAELFRLLERTDHAPPTVDALMEIADWCFLCDMCRLECEVHVDVPLLMLELKGRLQAADGPRRFEWLVSRLDFWARWGSRLAPLSNFLLRRRTIRWLLEKISGVARQRPLPSFAVRSFFRRARRRGWTNRPPADGRERLAYFVDLFAAYHDPWIAEATVAVLQYHGCAVYVPPRQWSAGMGPWSVGDLETFRQLAARNVRLLAELARDGFQIVCSEPTAALLLRRYYPLLLADNDSRLVAEHTIELTALLHQWHQHGRLRRDFQPLPWRIAHHTPCHLKALNGPAATPQLLQQIPGLYVHALDAGCSGMAGTWGQQAAHVPSSLQIAAPLAQALQHTHADWTISECSACRLQLRHLTGRRSFHPILILAWAYGLLPLPAHQLYTPVHPLLAD